MVTEGEYMETEARLEIPGPGGVTSVDTDGRIVIIGQNRFSSYDDQLSTGKYYQ